MPKSIEFFDKYAWSAYIASAVCFGIVIYLSSLDEGLGFSYSVVLLVPMILGVFFSAAKIVMLRAKPVSSPPIGNLVLAFVFGIGVYAFIMVFWYPFISVVMSPFGIG